MQFSEFEVRTVEPGPLQAVQLSLRANWEWSGLIFKTLGGLFTRETSPKQLMGPVAIAQLSGGAAQAGWIPLFTPDGDDQPESRAAQPDADSRPRRRPHRHHGARRAWRAATSACSVKEKILLAGFVLLMMLMVTVIYNDLTRIPWIENLMPWR